MRFFVMVLPEWWQARARLMATSPWVAARPFFGLSPAVARYRLTDLAIFLAGLHAYVVFSLACLRGVIFHAGLLLIPTLLATARLLGSCCSSDATNTEQHNDNGSDSWHDELLSMLATAPSSPTPSFSGSNAGPQSCGPAVKSLGRRSALCARRLVERGAQPLGELHGVIIGPEVHEEQPRLLVEHVAVHRRHFDAVRAQRLDHG